MTDTKLIFHVPGCHIDRSADCPDALPRETSCSVACSKPLGFSKLKFYHNCKLKTSNLVLQVTPQTFNPSNAPLWALPHGTHGSGNTLI